MSIQQFITPKSIRAALRCWQNPSGTSEDLLSSLLLVQEQQTAVSSTLPLRHATNAVLQNAIDTLSKHAPKRADILRLRFIKENTAEETAEAIGYATDTIYRQQREAIKSITTIINQWEGERQEMKRVELESDLQPPTYSHLFGADSVQKELAKRLLNSDGDWVVGVIGIGGMGKTAVSDSAVRHLLPRFYFKRALWVRMEPDAANGRFASPEHAYNSLLTQLSSKLWGDEAAPLSQQERLTRLHHQFSQHPYLIIVDNLEDPDDTAYIVEQMHRMTNPSKLLITSRAKPQTAVGFYPITVGELTEIDAIALMHHHARENGIEFMTTATKDNLHAIYQTIGGNPYAIKLVVDLLDLWPLDELLDELGRGNSGSPQKIYTHIYWQTWRSLSENARLLLQAMPLVADMGGTTSQLKAITALQDQFYTAVSELRHRSLIEVRGTMQEKRYGIHRLTQTFVSTEITGWEGDG